MHKAESVGQGGISSDDPDAVTKLREQLAGMERNQAAMVAANKAIRKHRGNLADQIAALVASGFTEDQAPELLKPDYMGRVGFADYALKNNNANIRRVRNRIADLERMAERVELEKAGAVEAVEIQGNGYTYREDVEDNRAMFLFEGKPDAATREILKKHAFNWSPSREGKPWVRKLTGSGKWAAQMVREALEKLTLDRINVNNNG